MMIIIKKSAPLVVPTDSPFKNIKELLNAAARMSSSSLRGLQVEWDGSALEMFLLASSDDLFRFQSLFENAFSCSFADADVDADTDDDDDGGGGGGGAVVVREKQLGVLPEWVNNDLDPASVDFFDVESASGHPFVLWDTSNAGTLIEGLMHQLVHTRRALVQILWKQDDGVVVRSHLNELSRRVRERKAVIDAGEWVYTTDPATGKSRRVKVEHRARGGEFDRSCSAILGNLRDRGMNLTLVFIRGFTEPASELSTTEITDLAVNIEGGGSARLGESAKVYHYRDPTILLDLAWVQLPDIERSLRDFVVSYVSGFRRNLPFLIMSPGELGLVCHLPDPKNLPMRSTRTSQELKRKILPHPAAEKPKEGPSLWG